MDASLQKNNTSTPILGRPAATRRGQQNNSFQMSGETGDSLPSCQSGGWTIA